jgi:ABC-type polysaccharide/polyol phosphate transport system ATPase subunit
MTEYALKVEKVSKKFRVPHEKQKSLKGSFLSLFSSRSYTEFSVLNDINFEVKKGEFFGIIGRNGSGKSTLLKIMSKIYVPDTGRVKINGRLSPFLELGVGFNQELSARDNVYLSGSILGLTRKEVDEKFSEIVRFAELEEFIDQKLRNFSSGMQVRLAFSVAIQAHSEVLLIDEVLAVGDANFQEKCFSKFKELKAQKKTIIYVSHDMHSIKDFCDRVMLIDKGQCKVIGSVEKAVQSYGILNEDNQLDATIGDRWGNRKVTIDSSEISVHRGLGSKDSEKEINDLTVRVNYTVHQPVEKLNFAVTIYREDGLYVFDTNTDIDEVDLKGLKKEGHIDLVFRAPNIMRGNYYLKLGAYNRYDKETLDFYDKGPAFSIPGTEKDFGIVRLDHEWRVNREG